MKEVTGLEPGPGRGGAQGPRVPLPAGERSRKGTEATDLTQIKEKDAQLRFPIKCFTPCTFTNSFKDRMSWASFIKKIDVKDCIQCKTLWARRNEHIKSLSVLPHCLKLNLTTFTLQISLINLISVVWNKTHGLHFLKLYSMKHPCSGKSAKCFCNISGN